MNSKKVAKKPKVAGANEKKALDNLIAKIAVLEKWCVDGVPDILLSDADIRKNGRVSAMPFPTSLRRFNRWAVGTSKSERLANIIGMELLPNSHDTLQRYEQLRERVQEVISLLKQKWLEQTGQRKEKESVTARKLRLAEVKQRTLELELVDLRRRLRESERSKEIAEKELSKIRATFKKEIERYQARNQSRSESNGLGKNVYDLPKKDK